MAAPVLRLGWQPPRQEEPRARPGDVVLQALESWRLPPDVFAEAQFAAGTDDPEQVYERRVRVGDGAEHERCDAAVE